VQPAAGAVRDAGKQERNPHALPAYFPNKSGASMACRRA
jgi:hypothetical protein